MIDHDSIEETREAMLDLIRAKAEKGIEAGSNAQTTELLARAFHLVATARAKDPESTVHVW